MQNHSVDNSVTLNAFCYLLRFTYCSPTLLLRSIHWLYNKPSINSSLNLHPIPPESTQYNARATDDKGIIRQLTAVCKTAKSSPRWRINRACSLTTTDFVCDVSVKTDLNQWAAWQPCCNTDEWLPAEGCVQQCIQAGSDPSLPPPVPSGSKASVPIRINSPHKLSQHNTHTFSGKFWKWKCPTKCLSLFHCFVRRVFLG